MKKSFYEIVEEVSTANEIIPRHMKTQALNVFKMRIDELERRTLDKTILNALTSLSMLLEDAYNIDMYRFQFTLLSDTLNKELKNIEEMISYAAEEQ